MHPPGDEIFDLVDIGDGRTMFLECSGTGSPSASRTRPRTAVVGVQPANVGAVATARAGAGPTGATGAMGVTGVSQDSVGVTVTVSMNAG